jgi:uncharacterized protein (TIGR03435 family)
MKSSVSIFLAAMAAVVIAAIPAAPQTATAGKPAFEVISIKPNTSGEGSASVGDQPGGRFVASRIALRRVIQYAYRGNQQFLGGPSWLDDDRWDIEARAAEGAVPPRAGIPDMNVPDTVALMVQSLLEDRFKLKSHRETRELPLYELTITKSGSKLKLSDDQTPPAALLGAGGTPRGGLQRGGIRLGRGSLEAQAQPLTLFATALGALYADRPVIDKTGLKGLYDFKLQFTPDPGLTAAPAPGGVPSTAAPLGPSLFTALEDQLGLKLESGKGPLPVLVIDSVQKPSAN